MLIFVSGRYPILGTQMLYFLDPELTRRAAIEVPKEFVAIENGCAVPQPAINRTRNAISKPEILPPTPAEPITHAERGFLEELVIGK